MSRATVLVSEKEGIHAAQNFRILAVVYVYYVLLHDSLELFYLRYPVYLDVGDQRAGLGIDVDLQLFRCDRLESDDAPVPDRDTSH